MLQIDEFDEEIPSHKLANVNYKNHRDMSIKKTINSVFFLLILTFCNQSVLAENSNSKDIPWEKFSFNVGWFISDINSNFRIGSGVGIDIDAEELLGLESSDSAFRIDSYWRFTDNHRHRLDFKWFSFHRSASRKVLQNFEIEGPGGGTVEVPAGSIVDSYVNLDIL